MDSLSQFYLDLIAQLQTLDTPPQWIDLYADQFNDPKAQDMPLPAILLDLSDYAPRTLGGGKIQRGEILLKVYMVQEAFEESFEGSANQGGALARLAYISAVHAVLQSFTGTVNNALDRVEARTDITGGFLPVDIFTYKCMLTDTSADNSVSTPVTPTKTGRA